MGSLDQYFGFILYLWKKSTTGRQLQKEKSRNRCSLVKIESRQHVIGIIWQMMGTVQQWVLVIHWLVTIIFSFPRLACVQQWGGGGVSKTNEAKILISELHVCKQTQRS